MKKKSPPVVLCCHCHQTLSTKWIKNQYKRLLGQGRPRTLRACEFCGKEFGVREMRKHVPRCRKNPGRRGARG